VADATKYTLRFARFLLAGVTKTNDTHLPLFFASNAGSENQDFFLEQIWSCVWCDSPPPIFSADLSDRAGLKKCFHEIM